MGYKFDPKKKDGSPFYKEFKDGAWESKNYFNPLYHTSWDWLMPVVEKLNEVGVWTIRPGFVCFESHKGEQTPERKFKFTTSTMDWEREDDEAVEFIFLVFNIVTKAVTWYNTQQQ